MLAPAVASCVSLMVAQEMAKAHVKYEEIKTEAVMTLPERAGHWDVSEIELEISSNLPEREAEKVQKAAKAAKTGCPISQALKVPIKLTTKVETVEQAAVV
jgi:osmotically inducible protein OsmC